MEDKCAIILEKETYSPGEVLSGKIECNFTGETKITGIRVKITGGGRVSWRASRFSYYRAEEIYLDMSSDVLTGEMTVPAGSYSYPFTFNLPTTLPSSMSEGDPSYFRDVAAFVIPFSGSLMNVYYGAIVYTIEASVSRSWATNYEAVKEVNISSSYHINTNETLKKPLEINKAIRPKALLKESGPIGITVQLPVTGYVPTQGLRFTVKIKNESAINIEYIQFTFVQGFVFHAEQQSKSIDTTLGEDFVIKDSAVEAGTERSWKLELKVPDLFLGNFDHSNIIKIFWELRGDVSLPFPHYNFSIHVPITLGIHPISGHLVL